MRQASAVKETDSDLQDTTRILQLSFFGDVTGEDIRKTKHLLRNYADLLNVVDEYEYAQLHVQGGLNEFDLSNAEGGAGRSSRNADVTGNTVVLKEKRYNTYLFYKHLSSTITRAISNIRDPHEREIIRLLFLVKMKYSEAQRYMSSGYSSSLYPIHATAFSERRKKIIKCLANSFALSGVLEYVAIVHGPGLSAEGECKISIPKQWKKTE